MHSKWIATLVLFVTISAGSVASLQAQIDLNGGNTHTVGAPAPVITANTLNGFAFDVTGQNGDQTLGNTGDGTMSNGLFNITIKDMIVIDGTDRIDYRNDNDFNNGDAGLNAEGFTNLNQNDNFATMFRAQLVVPDLNAGNPYDIEFGTNRADDPVQIYVDLNQDNVFDHGSGANFNPGGVSGPFGEMILNRDCCGNGFRTISLAPGTYEYMALQLERGGGSQIEPTIDLTLDAFGRRTVRAFDSDRPGLFQTIQAVAPPQGNVTVDGPGNVIELPASATAPTQFGSLTFDGVAPNNQLIINTPGGMAQTATFTGTTLSGQGDILTINDMNIVSPGVISGSGPLTVNGNGIVELDQANTFTGTLLVDGAVARVGNNSGLGASGAGNETSVAPGGSVLITGGNFAIAETIFISGTGNSKSAGALHSQGGNLDYNGAVNLPSGDALIVKDGGGDLEFRGGINLGGNNLTLQNDDTVRIFNNGLNGSGNLIKQNNGVLELRTSSNSFTGDILVQNGRVDANGAGNVLGTNAGDTIVSNNASLWLRDGHNSNESVFITGNGRNGNEGALRQENNTNSIGAVTMTGDSRIHAQSGQLTIASLGEQGGARSLEKTGGGSLIVSGAASHSGSTNVTQGLLQVGGLANTSDVNLSNGTTLLVDGNSTVNAPINSGADTTIGNSSAGTTTTFSGAFNLSLVGDVTLGGDGDAVFTQPIGNGNVPVGVTGANTLSHFGFHINNDGVALDLDGNGGIMGGGSPFSGPNFFGVAALSDGPGGRGLDFNNDGDFTATGAIGQNDNYSNLFVGTLTVSAADAGNWNFRRVADDDRMGIWLDLDQDGVFESSTPGLGSDRGEQLQWDNDGGTKTVNLTAGDYLFAVTHREGGGGSQVHVEFSNPNLTTRNIKPGEAAQAGIFSGLQIQPDNSVTKTGSGTTTFAASNTYNGTTTVEAGTLVAAADNALGIADGTAATGTTVNNGATLAITGGSNIGNEALTLGTGPGPSISSATLRSSGGDNVAGGNITAGSNVLIDSQAGSSLTIGGGIDLNGASGGRLSVQGDGETTISGAITGNAATTSIGPTTAGLTAGILNGNPDETTPNPGNLGVSFTVDGMYRNDGPNDAQREAHWGAAKANGGGNGPGNATLVYTGQIFLPGGDVTFVEQNDDKTRLSVDGVQVLSDDSWDTATAGTINRAAGWYDFEARFSNGGGGYGFFDQGGWGAVDGGFGFTTGIPGDTNPGSYTLMPTDPGDASLFRVAPPDVVLANDLHFFGNGILRLDGDNTYVGTTSVGDTNGAFGTPNATTGTLIVNGTTSGQGSYFISSGATLGGNGTIGLAAGESVNISGSPANVSPGDGGPGYDNPANPAGQFSATYSHGTDMSTVGTLTFMAATSTDTALNLDGNLQLDIMGPNPGESDMLVASMGIIDIDESTAMLEINGQTDFSLLDLSSVLMGGDELILISATDGLLGQFANDAKDGDSFVDQSGLTFTFAQDDTTLSLIAGIPEPTTIAIWTILGLAGFGFACRQRLARKG